MYVDHSLCKLLHVHLDPGIDECHRVEVHVEGGEGRGQARADLGGGGGGVLAASTATRRRGTGHSVVACMLHTCTTTCSHRVRRPTSVHTCTRVHHTGVREMNCTISLCIYMYIYMYHHMYMYMYCVSMPTAVLSLWPI